MSLCSHDDNRKKLKARSVRICCPRPCPAGFSICLQTFVSRRVTNTRHLSNLIQSPDQSFQKENIHLCAFVTYTNTKYMQQLVGFICSFRILPPSLYYKQQHSYTVEVCSLASILTNNLQDSLFALFVEP